jgi:hypothetical protein
MTKVYQNLTNGEIQIQTIGRQWVKLGAMKKITLQDHEDAFMAPLVTKGIVKYLTDESVPDYAAAMMKLMDLKLREMIPAIADAVVAKLIAATAVVNVVAPPVAPPVVAPVAPPVAPPVIEPVVKVVVETPEIDSVPVENTVSSEVVPSEPSTDKFGRRGKRH